MLLNTSYSVAHVCISQRALSYALRGGEKQAATYFVFRRLCIGWWSTHFDFQGCFYHSCSYNENVSNTTYGQTLSVQKTFLQSFGYTVHLLREHEWDEMLDKDSKPQTYLLKMQFLTPLHPCAALYGGRTNAIKLHHEQAEGETIRYYDFNSLYPYVNKTKTYPVGHPCIIDDHFGYIKKYFGTAKVKV